jgi:hypothetical protein
MTYQLYMNRGHWSFAIYDQEWMEAYRQDGFATEAEALYAANQYLVAHRPQCWRASC